MLFRKKLKYIFYLISIIILSTAFIETEDTYISFMSEINLVENCEGNEATIRFELNTNSNKEIKVYGLKFNYQDFTLIVNNKKKNVNDTLNLSKTHPLTLEIRFKRHYQITQNLTQFQTNEQQYLKNAIRVKYGTFSINKDMVASGKNQRLKLSRTCNDSVKVFFPYGGTITLVSLYKVTSTHEQPTKSISYHSPSRNNYIMFSENDTGKYFVKFSSCHWGNNFWLTLE